MKRLALLLSISVTVAAQTFEVASVKPAAPYNGGPIHIGTSGGPGTDDPGRLTFSNATLKMILTHAFGVESYQIVGPDWLNIDMFDISAGVPPGTTREQMDVMLRNLVMERFRMTTHREKQELPAYVLTVSKGGPKMKVADPANAAKGPPSGTQSTPGITKVTCNRCTISRFVGMLGNPNGHIIFDETGLPGTYDFVLTFEPEFGKCRGCVAGGGNGDPTPPPIAPDPSVEPPPLLTIAVRQQLGLNLEQKKKPVDVIVVDRIEKTPAEN
jgi:uncharacterized protein (TIGR03435 family)